MEMECSSRASVQSPPNGEGSRGGPPVGEEDPSLRSESAMLIGPLVSEHVPRADPAAFLFLSFLVCSSFLALLLLFYSCLLCPLSFHGRPVGGDKVVAGGLGARRCDGRSGSTGDG